MAPKLIHTSLPEVLIIQPDVFRDSRGYFMENYHRQKYGELGIPKPFVQDNHSRSSRGTLRGMHYQLNYPQAKLLWVVRGEIFDVAVDIRRGSPTFGRWFGEILSEENHYQIYIPEGFAHGFFVLSETADLMYKCTDFYHAEDDRGIHWSDRTVNIMWPQDTPLTSNKDSCLPYLENVPPEFLPVYNNI